MAAEVEEATGVKASLIEGSRGIFDVTLDGRVVYSKAKARKFPDQGEVARLIQNG